MNGESEPSFQNSVDLIKSINPEMDAGQAVSQIREFNRREYNNTRDPVIEARRQLLKENSFDPDNWTFYSNTSRGPGQSDESIMERLARPFPPEVELLVIQGSFLGGVTGTPGVSENWGVSRYKQYPDGYTVFIRVRPKQLVETVAKKKESPPKQSQTAIETSG